MEPVRLAAGKGWEWVGDGWRTFAANPGMWIVLVIIWLLILVALQMIPFAGALAAWLLAPALAGGLLQCARDALQGRAIDVGQLFDALTSDRTRGPVLVLGALFLLANLVVMFVALALAMGTVGVILIEHHAAIMGSAGSIDAALVMQLGMRAGLVILVACALGLAVWLLFHFAIPLVVFADVRPVAALGLGMRGILRNWLPLLVLGVIWLVLALLASVPLLLGWLVLLPVTFGAWYATYRDVFPGTGEVPVTAKSPMQAEPD